MAKKLVSTITRMIIEIASATLVACVVWYVVLGHISGLRIFDTMYLISLGVLGLNSSEIAQALEFECIERRIFIVFVYGVVLVRGFFLVMELISF